MFSSWFSFRLIYPWSALLLLSAASLGAAMQPGLFPAEWGYENALPENLQLVLLAMAAVLCCKAKHDGPLYIWAAALICFLMLREISFGRTIFFPVEGEVNRFYPWREIAYGWLAHWAVGVYVAVLVLSFFVCRLWRPLAALLLRRKFPFWPLSLLLVAICCTVAAEKGFHNAVAEELAEIAMYGSLAYLAAVYTRYKEV